MWDPYDEFQSVVLPNGLSVHVAHWPGRSWEAVGFLIHSGAEQDLVGFEGLAHFVEHMVSGNTEVSKKNMNVFFKDCGGIVSFGETGYFCTNYGFFVPIDKTILVKAFSMFGHMLLLARLEKFIERECKVIIGEFNRFYPVRFKFDLDVREHNVLYAGYWLERFVRPFGNPESIVRITQDELQLYYDTYYTPANMSVVCVGGMQPSEIFDILSDSPFAVSKKGSRTLLPVPVADVVFPLETRYVFEASKHMTIPIEIGGYRSVAKIPGKINRRVVNIVKNMLDEVLKEEVRERRAWAYTIGSSWQNLRYFYEFSINCSALALSAIDEVEEVVDVCIASIYDREDLFDQVKHRVIGRNLMIDLRGRDICDNVLEHLSCHQRIIPIRETVDDLRSVTMDDVRNVLKWLSPERRWTLIVRP